MNADKIMTEIRDALGDPSSGALKDAMPLIEQAVKRALGGDGGKGGKEVRVTKPTETRAN